MVKTSNAELLTIQFVKIRVPGQTVKKSKYAELTKRPYTV